MEYIIRRGVPAPDRSVLDDLEAYEAEMARARAQALEGPLPAPSSSSPPVQADAPPSSTSTQAAGLLSHLSSSSVSFARTKEPSTPRKAPASLPSDDVFPNPPSTPKTRRVPASSATPTKGQRTIVTRSRHLGVVEVSDSETDPLQSVKKKSEFVHHHSLHQTYSTLARTQKDPTDPSNLGEVNNVSEAAALPRK